jgi:hypothetical protein
MKTPAIAFTLTLILACSCASQRSKEYTTQTGDLGLFIVDSATRYGGHPDTNGVPIIQTEWRCRPDNNGIVIYVAGDRLSEIQPLLSRAFGEPDSARGSKPLAPCSPSGRKNGWYSHQQLGISIYFYGDKEETGVIILRGKT